MNIIDGTVPVSAPHVMFSVSTSIVRGELPYMEGDQLKSLIVDRLSKGIAQALRSGKIPVFKSANRAGIEEYSIALAVHPVTGGYNSQLLGAVEHQKLDGWPPWGSALTNSTPLHARSSR